MLRDEMDLYTKLSGEDATHVPIMKIGAYLDGYEKGLSVLEDIKAKISDMYPNYIDEKGYRMVRKSDVLNIIDKHMESEENNAEV